MALLKEYTKKIDNQFEIDFIIDRQKYPLIYNATTVLLCILIIGICSIFTCKYQSYYTTMGAMKDNELELLVNIDDIKYLKNNDTLLINKKEYTYKISKISKELYMDNNYNNYRYIYLGVNNLKNIDYYTYQVQIPKDNKTLAWYIKKIL